MKTTKILSAILCLVLAMSVFASCSSGEEEAIPSYDIREDVIKAYELDDEGKKIVCEALAAMESAFDTLAAASPVGEEDFAAFAEAINEANNVFGEKFYEAYEKPMKDRHVQANSDAMAALGTADYDKPHEEYEFLTDMLGQKNDTYGLLEIQLTSALFNLSKGETSAESASETALNYAIQFSTFFIGESIITDDMIDSIEFE